MTKVQLYLGEAELLALRKAAQRSGRSRADLIREAIRRVWVYPDSDGPVGLWDGAPRRTSVQHDTVRYEP